MSLNLNQYIYDLKKIVNIPSSSGNIIGLQTMMSFFMDQAQELFGLCYLQVFNQNTTPCLILSNATIYEEIDVLLLADLDTAPLQPNPNFLIRNNFAYGLGVVNNKGGALLGMVALQNLNLNKLNGKLKFAYILNSHSLHNNLDNHEVIQKFSQRSRFIISLANPNTGEALAHNRYGIATYRVEFEAPPTSRISCNDEYSALLCATNFLKNIHTLNKMTYGNFINFTLLDTGERNPNFIPHQLALAIQIRFLDQRFINYFEKKANSFKFIHENAKVQIYWENRLFYPQVLGTKNTHILQQYVEKAGKSLGIPISWATALGKSNALFAYNPNCAMIEGMGPIGGLQFDEYLDLRSVIPRTKLLIKTIETIIKNKETKTNGRNY